LARFLFSGTKRILSGTYLGNFFAIMVINPDLHQVVNAIRRGQFAEAAISLSQILVSRPNDVQARWLLVQSLESQAKTADALDQLRALLIHVKKDLPAIDRVASHMRQKRYPLQPVLQAYKKYLAYHPKSANAAFNYAYSLARDAQFEEAINKYQHSLKLGISSPEEVHLNIANIYMDYLHDHASAKVHLQKALTINPVYASAFYNLGNLSEQEGDRREARRNFEKCLETDPANIAALARLADTHKFMQQDDPLLARLVAATRDSNNSDVHFALGKAYEQIGDLEMAWQHFSKGNALDKTHFPAYSPENTEADFNRIIMQCDRKWFSQYEGSSCAPVFICGMFRTGSTLLEQFLASHPGFVAGGESEFFPRLVAREFADYPKGLDNISAETLRSWRKAHEEQTKRLFRESLRQTDKRPDNFLYIGLIKAILPSAKFVVTERDWRDVAASIYSVRLGPSQPYATSLQNIHHYIGAQTELIDHWESVLGSDLKRVRYEDLVLRPQPTVTGLLNWLGEDWDARCLSFHELKNNVKTASVWQVREPLHAKSIGRWKNYKQAFEQVFSADLLT
jgi:tetratricopeptide (TPR) repeat protein